MLKVDMVCTYSNKSTLLNCNSKNKIIGVTTLFIGLILLLSYCFCNNDTNEEDHLKVIEKIENRILKSHYNDEIIITDQMPQALKILLLQTAKVMAKKDISMIELHSEANNRHLINNRILKSTFTLPDEFGYTIAKLLHFYLSTNKFNIFRIDKAVTHRSIINKVLKLNPDSCYAKLNLSRNSYASKTLIGKIRAIKKVFLYYYHLVPYIKNINTIGGSHASNSLVFEPYTWTSRKTLGIDRVLYFTSTTALEYYENIMAILDYINPFDQSLAYFFGLLKSPKIQKIHNNNIKNYIDNFKPQYWSLNNNIAIKEIDSTFEKFFECVI